MFTITNKEFTQLTNYIRANYGINLKEEKRSLLIGRLQNVLTQKNLNSFSDLFEYIVSDKSGDAESLLIDRITTNHTFFMRESGHFDYFRDIVLPYLANAVKDKDLRVWSAGCSTGEEPYTLAMLVADFFGKSRLWWDTKILATDISGKALESAKKGIYSNDRLSALPISWRQNYFKKFNSENSMVTESIKKEVIFRKFNLVGKTFPFKNKFHVIFCRNVMIYFDEKTKLELINHFYDLTEDGGYLFIGHSESINRKDTKYKYILPAVYRKE